MKKTNRILSLLLSCVIAIGSFSFAGISVSANETTILFEETFESGFGSNTNYGGKTGTWKNAEYFMQSGTGDSSEIHLAKGQEKNVDFNFTEPYQEAMVLKVTAEVVTGVADSNNLMRIDVVGLNDVDTTHDSGRVSLCTLTNGKIYANCLTGADARDTGATYTEGQRLIFEGIIDEANKTFTLSVYDKETGDEILKNHSITPYKHDKANYYELTHGFTGIRFQAKRASDAAQAFELYNISVVAVGEESEEPEIPEIPEEPETDSVYISLFSETFGSGFGSNTSYGGKTGTWKNAEYFMQSGTGDASEIHVSKGQEKNVDFNFTEPYQEVMTLKVTAEVVAGVADSNNYMRIDVVGLNDVDTTTDSGRESLCYLTNGKIYVNTLSATDARDTGATYTEGQRLVFEGIIDEANKTFTLSVYDKATGEAILENYNVDPYKHDKANYYELTHGFTGIRFMSKRASDAGQAFELYDIKVEKVVEAVAPWVVTEGDITLSDAEGAVQNWNEVSVNLDTIEIDFGEAMEEETLTKNTIYVENYETGDKVEYTPGYESNVYTLTLNEELEEDTTYNIVIKNTVTSAVGGVNTEDTVFSFKTEIVEIPEEDADVSGRVLFEETFESGFGKNTSYGEKVGAWKNADGFLQSGTGAESEIHVSRGQEKNVDFAFNDPYREQMILKVTAGVVAGNADSNNLMRIDVVGLNDVDTTYDSGRISLCTLSNGKIYANCLSGTDARYTGATYTTGQKLIFVGVIDQANKTFKLSVYDKETGESILKDYIVTPYKHDKANYYELTHGFTGIRFMSKRASDADQAFELYDIRVETLAHSELSISESNIKLTTENGTVQSFDNASILTNKIEVNFGMPMNVSSLSTSTVYILNTKTNKKVAYTGSYSENIYTMNLATALDIETEYQIVFTSAIKTADGYEYGETAVIPFTTVSADDVLETDDGYNRTFEFDDLTDWSMLGTKDTFVSGGKLSVPTSPVGERQAIYTFDPAHTEKMILDVSYEISAGSNTLSRVEVRGTSGYIVLANFNGGYIYANTYSTENSTGVAYEPGKTYTVKCKIDQHNEVLSVTVLDENGNAIVSNFQDAPFGGNNGRGVSVVGLKEVRVVNSIVTTGDIAPVFDNLTIKEVLEAPTISENDISIGVIGGETAENFNNVNPASNMITLDVGTILNTATLNSDNVKILKGNEEVDATITYANRTITIIINEVLSANTQHTVFVSENVENVDGVKMNEDFALKFTTGAAKVTANVKCISVNDNVIENMSQISDGDNLYINIDYMNSTGNDKTLYVVIAGYKGNSLTRANYITQDIDKSIVKDTIVIESGAFNTNDVEKVMVMLWDGFDTMHPLSPCVSIN